MYGTLPFVNSPDAPSKPEPQNERVRELLETLQAKRELLMVSGSAKVAAIANLPLSREIAKGLAAEGSTPLKTIDDVNAALLSELEESDAETIDDPASIIKDDEYFSRLEDVSDDLKEPIKNLSSNMDDADAELREILKGLQSDDTLPESDATDEDLLYLDENDSEEHEFSALASDKALGKETSTLSDYRAKITISESLKSRLIRIVDDFQASSESRQGRSLRFSVLQTGAGLLPEISIEQVHEFLSALYSYELFSTYSEDEFSDVSMDIERSGIVIPDLQVAQQLGVANPKNVHVDYVFRFNRAVSESDIPNEIHDDVSDTVTNVEDEATEDNADEENKSTLDSISRSASPPSSSRSLPGQTRVRSKFYAAIAASLVVLVAGGVSVYYVFQTNAEKITKVEKQVNEGLENVVLVNVDEFERLKDELDLALRSNESIKRNFEEQIRTARDEEKTKLEAQISDRIEEVRKRGFEDGAGVKSRALDRVTPLSYPMAVVNGFCFGFGRGNRIDKVHTTNNTLKVMSWLVNPENLHIVGVRGQISSVLAEGYSEVECLSGEADIYPSAKNPVVGADGRAEPVDSDGKKMSLDQAAAAQR